MNRKWLVLGLVLIVCLLLGGSIQAQIGRQSTMTQPVVDQLMIQFQDEAQGQRMSEGVINGRLQKLSRETGYALNYVRPMSGQAHVVQLPHKMDFAGVSQLASQLARRTDVVYAHPNGRLHITSERIPNDPRFAEQWHYGYTPNSAEGLNLPAAWDITTGNSNTIVAILDTGVVHHSEFAGRLVPGYDFLSDVFAANDGDGRDNDPSDPGDWVGPNECGAGSSPEDSSWHGTHVGGTIGANSNNNAGIAGVNWQTRMMHVRVLGRCGGSYADIIDGMRWAAGLSVPGVPNNPNPAHVLNMSLGGPGDCFVPMQQAINDIVAMNRIIVVAAGNDNLNSGSYVPAGCDNAITVAATNRSGGKADYSNFGQTVEVSTPGGETGSNDSDGVLSTLDGSTTAPNNDNVYRFYQGTSMAAPHVAGAIALLLDQRPNMTSQQVAQHLMATTRPFPAGSSCNTNICGTGIVDAHRMLTMLPSSGSNVYLPYLGKNATFNPQPRPTAVPTTIAPTPTATVPPQPTPTMTPMPPPNELPDVPNGDFEQGRNGDWFESSSNGEPLIANSGLPITPLSSEWVGWLGGLDNETSSLSQTLFLEDAPAPLFIEFHYQIRSDDACGFDLAELLLDSFAVETLELCSAEATSEWVTVTLDVSEFVGSSVTLEFVVTTDFSAPSSLFIDDVTFTQ
ncbi:MAG: S8 family peptidase [Chloroflexota bacterium]